MSNRKSGPPGALLTAAAAVIAVGATAGTASAPAAGLGLGPGRRAVHGRSAAGQRPVRHPR